MPPTPHSGEIHEAGQQEAQAVADAEFAKTATARQEQERSRLAIAFARGVVIFGVLLVALAITWKLGFLGRGHEKRRVTFNSPGISSRMGTSLGSKSILATAGQTISVKYNARVTRGYFKVWIRPKGVLLGPVVAQTGNLKTATGTLDYKVPSTGLYKIFIFGTPDGNGYDVTYEASWQTR